MNNESRNCGLQIAGTTHHHFGLISWLVLGMLVTSRLALDRSLLHSWLLRLLEWNIAVAW